MWNFIVIAIAFQEIHFLKILTDASFSNNIKIVRPPKNYFPISRNLQLNCEAEGDPMPVVVWYYEKTKTPVYEDKFIDLKVFPDRGQLVINNPKEKETYEFYCNASNAKQWVISKPAKTGTSYLSSEFLKEPPAILISNLTQTVVFPCQLPLGNPNPEVNWLKDRKLLLTRKHIVLDDLQRLSLIDIDNIGHDINKCSLQITNLKLSDSGRYQCVAMNEHHRSQCQNSWLLVMDSLTDKVFDINIKQLSMKVGDDVELLCHSNYKGSVKWISSKKLSENDLIYLYENKMLKRNLKVSDRGIYACETNTTDPKLLNIFNLSVAAIDSTDEKLKILRKVVIEGVNVVLECDLENTKAEVYWETPQSQPIFPNDYNQPRFRVTKDGYLNIHNVQSSDSGKYTCNVHSALDVKQKYIWLEVSKHQLDIYPLISLPTQNITVLKGSNINLKCEVIGEDIVKVVWYIGINIKERLTKDWQISFPTKESLLIIDAQVKKNTNFYTCEAINDQNLKSSWTSFVNVVENPSYISEINFRELPLPPVVESPKNIKSDSLDLFWSANNNPEYKTLYWIEYVYFGSKIGWEIYKRNWPQNFITVKNLKSDTWYQFLVRSKNDNGIGRASVPTEYVRTKNIMSDKPFSWNLGFLFNYIKLAEPELVGERQVRIKWFVNKDENENGFKTSFYNQFFLSYKPISIVKCIVDKSNGNPFEFSLIPGMSDYCSLRTINSEKLRLLKYTFSPKNETDIQIAVDFQRTNITKSGLSHSNQFAQLSWLISNFTYFHCYNISVVSKSEYKTIYSNFKLVLVPESKPSKPPDNIQISWMLPDIAINIKWDLPDSVYWNGIITSSIIYMKSNESGVVLKYNDSQSNRVISQVNPNLNWVFRVSYETCSGESEKSAPVLLQKLSDALLFKSDEQIISNNQKINLFKKSWMIATLVVTSVLIWLMLSLLTVYLCCSKSFKFHGYRFFSVKSTETDEISNNKDFKDGMIINPIRGQKKENELHNNENGKNCNITNLSLSPISSNSFCNLYASTQIFDSVPDHKIEPENMNLYYLSTPIFDSSSISDVNQSSLNYFLSNPQEWMGPPNVHNTANKSHPLPFPLYSKQDDCHNSQVDLHFENKAMPTKDQNVELSVLKNNGTISNLLLSTAPFSDQFTVSSKSKSTNNSSNSDSSHQQSANDHHLRLKKSNITSKPTKRRQEPGDIFDQSTEMTHLLANLIDNRPSFPSRDSNRVYDIPYSDFLSTIEKDN